MSEERFEAVSRAGEKVVVVWRQDDRRLEIQVGSNTYIPAWGSQACDDWLDWMASEERGEATALPVDEDDWLLDEGYHRE